MPNSTIKNSTSAENVPKNSKPEKNTFRKLHEAEDVKEVAQHTNKEIKYLKICQVAGSRS